MSTLTGTKIKDTYPGLIKLDDNGAVQPTDLKTLTDGTGGTLPISVSQVETKFTSGSLVDFTGTTVTGLAGAGLIAGSFSNTMISAPSLTTTAASVTAPNAIALGDNARGGGYAGANHAIAIGTDAYSEGAECVTLGKNAWSQSNYCIALGTDSHARLTDAISIGRSSQAGDNQSIAIGYDAQTAAGGGAGAIAIGQNANAGSAQSIAIGKNSTSSNEQTVAIGNGAVANNFQSVAVGDGAEATGVGAAAMGQYATASGLYSSAWGRTSYARAEGSVAFGQQAGVPEGLAYAGAIAMGRQVVAVNSDTTHVRALYIVAPDGGTGGNGITMLSPDGTAGVITLTNASELAVDGTPIGGGGGAAGLVDGGATGSQKSADSLSDGNNSATGYRSIAIGSGNRANDNIGVAIGNYTRAGNNSVAIGDNANTSYGAKSRAVSIGRTANAEEDGVAIGNQATASAIAAVALGNGVTAATANTATVNLFQIAGYATMNYVNDAAAATGGIPLGGVYHTDGALKIRIA